MTDLDKLIAKWKTSLEEEGPGGKLEIEDLESLTGASGECSVCSGGSCCPACTSNC